MNKATDITGKVFGKLTALEYHSNDKNGRHEWKFLCACEKIHIARKSSVMNGNTKQCNDCFKIERAILKTTHGKTKTRIYKKLAEMKSRCYNKNSISYPRYGGRGIKVCDEWNDFEVFEKWALNNGYSDNLTIDRIDFNGNYEPNNCRWATTKEQSNNKRNNIFIDYENERHTLSEWAELYGIKYSCIYARYLKNKNPESLFRGFNRKAV